MPCASFYALCIFRGQPCGLICMINFTPMFIPIICWTEHPPSLTRPTDREMPRYMNGRRVRRPPPSWLSLTLQLQRDPDSYTDAHLLLIIILCHHSLMSVSALLYSAEHTDMAQFPLGCLLTQHTSHSTAVLHMDTH